MDEHFLKNKNKRRSHGLGEKHSAQRQRALGSFPSLPPGRCYGAAGGLPAGRRALVRSPIWSPTELPWRGCIRTRERQGFRPCPGACGLTCRAHWGKAIIMPCVYIWGRSFPCRAQGAGLPGRALHPCAPSGRQLCCRRLSLVEACQQASDAPTHRSVQGPRRRGDVALGNLSSLVQARRKLKNFPTKTFPSQRDQKQLGAINLHPRPGQRPGEARRGVTAPAPGRKVRNAGWETPGHQDAELPHQRSGHRALGGQEKPLPTPTHGRGSRFFGSRLPEKPSTRVPRAALPLCSAEWHFSWNPAGASSPKGSKSSGKAV